MMLEYSLIALLSPLFGGIMAAFLGKSFGKNFVNLVTIIGVSISFVLSCIIALEIAADAGGGVFGGGDAVGCMFGSPTLQLSRLTPLRNVSPLGLPHLASEHAYLTD